MCLRSRSPCTWTPRSGPTTGTSRAPASLFSRLRNFLRCSSPNTRNAAMSNLEKPIRQSISLPPRVARRVKALARTKRTSANRVVVDLIEAGLEGQEQEKKRFFDLADRLVRSSNPEEEKRLKEELASMTFGE